MYLLMIVIIGYLFGCIHGSQIVGKYKKINIKKNGMKNAGASNATLLLGWKYGFIVAFIDVFKAIVSLLIVAALLNKFNVLFEMQILLLYVNALFVVIGHNFPLQMSFNGGKGTASLFGVLLYIDWKFAVMGLIILLLFAFVTNYFVTGTLMLYLSFIAYTLYTFGRAPTFVACLFTVLFFIKHAENFKRIVNKEEVKLSTLFRKEAS
ncbi:glycerol-3-phosphate acyltransferase [Pseudogracilibacillus auburnensis]|uniref:Glycerol-3-phosphate acyltransferase n=1 Tax=Pseudogracilibacillus auburnensis TaxID=1494959 RepID=A0A2V3VW78_9BACI|nr:glycerol-3-phosphate acyltransferase [Pseudogracilibacillus auburnensis]MBO1002367.1 glycerol-3-phosphate acyltransferase [Pseudogracilibacillus auburnensis]PXW86243.1 glycerol-3-phosphate acyltransferase PlsY [Pseudogracilibacillus auburnensis]